MQHSLNCRLIFCNMNLCSGFDLYKVFKELGIELGSIDENVLGNWFETGCEEINELLNVFCLYITNENVLTDQEIEEYEQLLADKLTLHGQEYEKALKGLQENNSDVFRTDNDLLTEIECLQDEIYFLNESKASGQHLIAVNENLKSILSEDLSKETEIYIAPFIEKDLAKKHCLEQSEKLEKVQLKLHSSILQCCENLSEFEIAATPKFISNMNMQKYDSFYNDIISHWEILSQLKQNGIPDTDNSLETSFNLSQSYQNDFWDKINKLNNRIFKSSIKLVTKQVIEEQKKTELKYLKETNISQLLKSNNPNVQFQMEVNNLLQKDLIEKAFNNVETVTNKIIDSYRNEVKLCFIRYEIKTLHGNLEYLGRIDNIILKIVSHSNLVNSLFVREQQDFKNIENLFKNVYKYITENLQQCEYRTNLMLNVINEYSFFTKLPIEERILLVKYVTNLLMPEKSNVELSLIADSMRQLEHNYKTVMKTKFSDNNIKHLQQCREMESHAYELMQVLCTGSIFRPTVISFKLHQMVLNVNSILYQMQNNLKKIVNTKTETQVKLSKNKWFKLERLLWVYFLTKPEKIGEIINNIKTEIKTKRNEAIDL